MKAFTDMNTIKTIRNFHQTYSGFTIFCLQSSRPKCVLTDFMHGTTFVKWFFGDPRQHSFSSFSMSLARWHTFTPSNWWSSSTIHSSLENFVDLLHSLKYTICDLSNNERYTRVIWLNTAEPVQCISLKLISSPEMLWNSLQFSWLSLFLIVHFRQIEAQKKFSWPFKSHSRSILVPFLSQYFKVFQNINETGIISNSCVLMFLVMLCV